MNTVGLARDSISMLEELGPKIKRTAELVQEIIASSRQQNSGIQQVIQQNASAAEEIASISEELASQAEMLPSAIAIVRTDEASVEQPALEYNSG